MTKLTAIVITAFVALISTYPVAAQMGKVPRVGVIMTGTPKTHAPVVKWLRQGLRELGYVEGRNIILEPRYSMGKGARLPKLAKELLQKKVDVIVVTGARAAKETRKASPSIPIVVAAAGNLVGSGVVASLAKPGGNTTGNTGFSAQLAPKQVQLLQEAIPGLARVGVFYNLGKSGGKGTKISVDRVKAAGPVLGVEVQDFGVRDQGGFEGAFAAMDKARTDALILIVSRLTSGYRHELIKLAAKWKIPTMCWRPSLARAGCFMSYGADRSAMYHRAATFVHKILKGARPGDLPVQQPTKFGLVINLKTARTLGITFPRSILLRADKVIE